MRLLYSHSSLVFALGLSLCTGIALPCHADRLLLEATESALQPAGPIGVLRPGSRVFSADGTLCAAAGRVFNPVLYDVRTGQELPVKSAGLERGEAADCRHLAFSPNGEWLVSLHDGSLIPDPHFHVILWKVSLKKGLQQAGVLLVRASRPTVYYAEFSPDSRSVVAGSPDGTVYIWECATRKERLHFDGGTAAKFSADGRTLITVTHDGLVRRFDAATGLPLPSAKDAGRTDFICAEGVAFSTAAERVAVWDEHEVLVLDCATGKRIQRLTVPEGCCWVGFSSDARLLAVATDHFSLGFFDVATGRDHGVRANLGRLVYSADHRLMDVEGTTVREVRDYEHLLGGCVPRPARPSVNPSTVPLQMELTSKKKEYVLNLEGMAQEEFSRRIAHDLPPGPPVELEFRVRNAGAEHISFSPKVETYLFLSGPGAMNVASHGGQVLAVEQEPEPEPVVLSPGQVYSIPISNLFCSQPFWRYSAYWLQPGDYAIYATCELHPSKGVRMIAGQSGPVTLRSAPLKVKVIEGKK